MVDDGEEGQQEVYKGRESGGIRVYEPVVEIVVVEIRGRAE